LLARFGMPASDDLQRGARIIGSGSLGLCLLLLFTAWSRSTPRVTEHSELESTRQTLSRLLQDSPGSAANGGTLRRAMRAPPAQTTKLLEETCDCSAATRCVEILETDVTPGGLLGGGATGLTGTAWGAWDPVTGVPRIDCPDTVTHAHCERPPPCPRRMASRARLRLCTVLRRPSGSSRL
jgi:hypothetical protein